MQACVNFAMLIQLQNYLPQQKPTIWQHSDTLTYKRYIYLTITKYIRHILQNFKKLC